MSKGWWINNSKNVHCNWYTSIYFILSCKYVWILFVLIKWMFSSCNKPLNLCSSILWKICFSFYNVKDKQLKYFYFYSQYATYLYFCIHYAFYGRGHQTLSGIKRIFLSWQNFIRISWHTKSYSFLILITSNDTLQCVMLVHIERNLAI